MTCSIPVYEWIDNEGVLLGCGTASELSDLKRQGIVPERAELGEVIGHEPAQLVVVQR